MNHTYKKKQQPIAQADCSPVTINHKREWPETTNKTKWINELILDIVGTIAPHKFRLALCGMCACVFLSLSNDWAICHYAWLHWLAMQSHANQMNLNNKDPPHIEMCHPESNVRCACTMYMCVRDAHLSIYLSQVRLQCRCACRCSSNISFRIALTRMPCDCDAFSIGRVASGVIIVFMISLKCI